VAPANKVTGNILGGVLPYMVILLCMIGGMYPAMDLTAGEKERGTMETLLCSPVHRVNLVLGKFLMVLTAALTTAVLSILSIAGTFQIGKRALGGSMSSDAGTLALSVDPWSVLGVFVMVLPVAFMLSAAQLAISLFARSFKEAQTYVTPLIFMTIIPSMVSLAPGNELNLKLALVPILNVSLVCKEIMTGTWHWPYITVIFGSTTLLALGALLLAVKLFQREEVLLRA
jgi:sodium transport system permease protein